ncbi:unnamed protein product [Ixodes persulcatus]
MVQPFRTLFNVCVSHAMGTSGGCCLFLRKSLGFVETAVISCAYGRFFLKCHKFCPTADECVQTCANATSRGPFSPANEMLASFLQTDKGILLLGDFNCVCFASNRARTSVVIDRSASFLQDTTEDCYLVDIGSLNFCQNKLAFTHFQGTSHARLDRISISSFMFHNISSYKVTPVAFIDHCLVVVVVGKGAGKEFLCLGPLEAQR